MREDVPSCKPWNQCISYTSALQSCAKIPCLQPGFLPAKRRFPLLLIAVPGMLKHFL